MSNGQVINSGAWYSVGKIRLIPGTWIILGNCSIMTTVSGSNATLYQRIINGDASKQYAADAIYTYLRNTQSTAIVDIDKTQDIFLQVYASASAQVYTNGMCAIWIK